jgi:ketosteroid isomerase-like protein
MKTRFAALLALAVCTAVPVRAADETTDIQRFMVEYDAAFGAKSMDRLAVFYHPEVTIFEGGGVNQGWADYRDHHLGPEMAEFLTVTFAHSNVVVHVLGADKRTAYVTSEYSLKVHMKERDENAGGLETLILLKGDDGAWRIRHSHTSSRRRPAPTPKP